MQLENGEPAHAGNAGGRSIWYRWTAPSAGTWTVDTAGSSFDTTLAIYTGTAVNALTLTAENDDTALGRTSEVTFTSTPGGVYRIAVDGYNGASGPVVSSFPGGSWKRCFTPQDSKSRKVFPLTPYSPDRMGGNSSEQAGMESSVNSSLVTANRRTSALPRPAKEIRCCCGRR